MHKAVPGSILTALLVTACGTPETPPDQAAAVTRDQFRQLQWIAGTWRGSGGNYPSFFEQYQLIDDSTLRMRSFADSTLETVTDSSTIGWRNGIVESRSSRSTYIAMAMGPDSIRFIKRGETGGGHTFTRVSADEWTATLHPADSGGQPVIYTMHRIRP